MINSHANAIFAAMPLALLLGGPAAAQSLTPPGQSGNTLVTVKAEPSAPTIHGGEQFLLAFRFEIAPHWHIYWKNPGDTGSATAIDIVAPEGFTVGDILWQRPRLIPGMFTSYGYEKEVTLLVPVTAPEALSDGAARFTAEISWLVCQETCLLGDATLEVTVGTSAAPPPEDSTASSADESLSEYRISNASVRAAAQLLPKPLADADGSMIERVGNRVTLSGPAHGKSSLTFFPSPSPGVSATIVKQTIVNDRFEIVLEVEVNKDSTLGQPPVAAGVIGLGTDDDDPSYSFEVALDD